MATRKRNEYLDIDESQDEESDYDSEAAENSKVARASKRRKVSGLHADALSDDQDDESEEDLEQSPEGQRPSSAKKTNGFDKTTKDHPPHDQQPEGNAIQPIQPVSRKDAKSSEPKKKNKTGVIYLSRIPPFMKPATVRHLLSPYGEISRLFLTPESPTSHSARVRHGGNKKRSFVDGWVEFVHKSDAKLVAETLNANIIGGKKGGYYHDDVWNMKYLKGFKWADLTEQIKNENAERAARLRMEIAQTTRENKRFVAGFEKAKMLEKMEAARKARGADGLRPSSGVQQSISHLDGSKDPHTGTDRPQNVSKQDHMRNKKDQQPSTDVKKVLDMIM